jgi:hypothetical protein
MITIRYADLPEGVHAQAVARGKRTIIYLRPGLTPQQRRDSLRRARQSGRMGHGPRLPAAWIALALADDAVRSTLGNLAAAVRGHPLGSLALLAAIAGGAVCYVLLVTVSMRFMAPPASTFSPGHVPHGRYGLGHERGPAPRRGLATVTTPVSRSATPAEPESSPSRRHRRHRRRPHPSHSPQPTPDPAATTPTPSSSPSPTPRSSMPPPTPSQSPSPSHSPSPSPAKASVITLCV